MVPRDSGSPSEDMESLTKEQLVEFISANPAVLYALSVDGDTLSPIWVSNNISRVLGYDPEACIGNTQWWISNVHPDDLADVFARLPTLMSTGYLTHEYRFRHGDGHYFWVRDEIRITRGGPGAVQEMTGAWMDITARKEIELELEKAHRTLENRVAERTAQLEAANKTLRDEIAEHRRTEAALRQSQKMEAIGQLTGGIAHDFNNLLSVISGNSELLQDRLGNDKTLSIIQSATRRGAELTQRLLAFSRQQTLRPRAVELGDLIPGLTGLLGRTLGEPINIVAEVADGTWCVIADPGQLENALLNLAINARDAMPDGGVLEISCANVHLSEDTTRLGDPPPAGDYVQISVRDNGQGMPENVLRQAFEPFYTTKDVGEGSGLGLSMVYGFAKQSGGDAVIDSKPGEGTEVRLVLPRGEAKTAPDEPQREKEPIRGQGEVILVLEDEPEVRAHVVNTLERLGYQTLEAANADVAGRFLEENAGHVDVLLSDIVLAGGVSGPEFAGTAKQLCPELKIVFMTGYAPDITNGDEKLAIGEALLQKPFKRADLALAIHEVLAK